MTSFLLKLFGAQVEDASRVSDLTLKFAGGFNAALVILMLLGCAALTWFVYRHPREGISRLRRGILTGLRIAFFGLLLLLLLRPVLSFQVEGTVRRSLVLLFDGTASMKIKDPRLADADLKRAAIGAGLLDPQAGLSQPLDRARARQLEQISRVDLLKEVLRNQRLELLPQLAREYDLSPFIFGQTIQDLVRAAPDQAGVTNTPAASAASFAWTDRLNAEIPQTAIGDAVRDVLSRKRGQPLAGIFLVTDGANNSGSPPREVAALARQEGVPLYIYGIGLTSPRDIIVANLFAPEVAFVRDEVPVTVRVRSQGMAGQSARLQLLLGQTKVEEKEIHFTADGETVVAMKINPQQKGNFELQALIEPRPDETVRDNNSAGQQLRVIDDKIKVLLVEQYPRWEYHYLHAMLSRDRRIEAKTVLIEGDPAIARGQDSPFLERFPTKEEDLFKFDVIILGDVDPKNLSPTQMESLNKFVSRMGGALIMVAGKRFAPFAYRRSVIERMLPVEFDALPSEGVGEVLAEKPVRLELTPAGKNHPMLRLADLDSENLARWKSLPPVYWVAKVSRAKPAAEVLLVDPDPAKETRFGKMPVMALQRYGSGQVLYLGTDNTWRWRRNIGDAFYVTLWGQMAQRMALPRLLGASKRTQLSTDRQNVITGDRVTVYGRLFTATFEPMTEPQARAIYALRVTPPGVTAPETEVVLRALPDQPGIYRGEFVAPAAGAYKFQVDHDRESQLDFNVTEPRFELGDTAMNETLLREMAASSGGGFFREEDLKDLCRKISLKTERVRSPMEAEIWSSWFYFLLLLAVVTAEWVLRKYAQLK